MRINLQGDPNMILSLINTKLRNDYKTLKDLCDDLGLDETIIQARMKEIDKVYDESTNQFVSMFND